MKPAVASVEASGDATTAGQVGAATAADGTQTGTKKGQHRNRQESNR
jgi:hypothetical protein